MSKKKLGSGIDALLGSLDNENASQGIHTLSINDIYPNPNQPRKHFAQSSLEELAISIKQQGVLQPILVEEHAQQYLIVAGERRYRAAMIAGLAEIPAIIRTFTDEQRLEVALLENIQREDLNPLEEAQAYYDLMQLGGMSQQQLAQRLGKSRSAISNSLRLLNLSQPLQRAVVGGELSAGHARALLTVDETQQTVLHQAIIKDGLSVRQVEKLVSSFHAQPLLLHEREPNNATHSHIDNSVKSNWIHKNMEQSHQALCELLKSTLKTPVSIEGDDDQGKIEIIYKNAETLKSIIQKLGQ